MKRSFRIAIADDEHEVRTLLHARLTRAGHNVVVEASSGEELVESCTAKIGELVQLIITDVKMRKMDGLVAAKTIQHHRRIPFIVISGFEDEEVIERASISQAYAYLMKPFRLTELRAAISIAIRRFDEHQSLHSETIAIRQALDDRKIIERAKGILMRERGLDEPSAFKTLQRVARQQRKKLVEIARGITIAEQALNAQSD